MDWIEKFEKVRAGRRLVEIERDAGWSENSLSARINQKNTPNAVLGAKLAKALGVSADWLFDDDNLGPPQYLADTEGDENALVLHLPEQVKAWIDAYEDRTAFSLPRFSMAAYLLLGALIEDNARIFVRLAGKVEKGTITWHEAIAEARVLLSEKWARDRELTPEGMQLKAELEQAEAELLEREQGEPKQRKRS